MIAVIDACAVLNLLQAVMEDKYFGYLESAFQKTGFPPKVFEEINENKYKNLSDEDDRSLLNRASDMVSWK
ncbi:MAG: hypothetical protein GY749_30590 [Desulfobacteraceae bacterium]|nr:hypothetical protein [Desulfobacteraceae bacterium]